MLDLRRGLTFLGSTQEVSADERLALLNYFFSHPNLIDTGTKTDHMFQSFELQPAGVGSYVLLFKAYPVYDLLPLVTDMV